MLESNDLPATIRFYTEILGFKVDNTFEHEGVLNWVSFIRDEVNFMFTRPNPVMKYDRIMLSGSLYVYITDIDAFYTGIKEKVTIVYPLENFIYGMREFAIKDNNGFVINFGCEV